MKTLNIILLSFIGFAISCGVSNSSEHNSEIELEKLALELIREQSFEQGVATMKVAAEKCFSKGDISHGNLMRFNIGMIYSDDLEQLDSASIYFDGVRNYYRQINDKFVLAQLTKYRGYIIGMSGDDEVGVEILIEAVDSFLNVDYIFGVADCWFRISKVNFLKERLESSKLFFERSDSLLKTQGGQSHIFTNNIFGLTLYNELGDWNGTQRMIDQNNSILKNYKISANLINKYKLSLKKLQMNGH